MKREECLNIFYFEFCNFSYFLNESGKSLTTENFFFPLEERKIILDLNQRLQKQGDPKILTSAIFESFRRFAIEKKS